MSDKRLIAAVVERAKADNSFCSELTACLLKQFEMQSKASQAKSAELQERDRNARIADIWKHETNENEIRRLN